jgi:histidine triad (HIT) family protein
MGPQTAGRQLNGEHVLADGEDGPAEDLAAGHAQPDGTALGGQSGEGIDDPPLTCGASPTGRFAGARPPAGDTHGHDPVERYDGGGTRGLGHHQAVPPDAHDATTDGPGSDEHGHVGALLGQVDDGPDEGGGLRGLLTQPSLPAPGLGGGTDPLRRRPPGERGHEKVGGRPGRLPVAHAEQVRRPGRRREPGPVADAAPARRDAAGSVAAMADCLFCKIVAGEIPSTAVTSTDTTYAFRDISPAAPVHVLVVPRRHITNASEIEAADGELLAQMILTAQQVAASEGIAATGYRLVFNVGDDALNSVPHLHLHVLGGHLMGWPPG